MGRFYCNRLPFGLRSAPEMYQRVMTNILSDIPGVLCLMDDVIVHGSNKADHDNNLRKVLDRLKEAGVSLNEKKCVFFKEKISFLGHIIENGTVTPDLSKITAIKNMPPPTNKHEVKQLNGTANYLAKFVPNLASILHPITSLLSQKNEFSWGPDQERSFIQWKRILTEEPVLRIFNSNRSSIISADASSYGLGCVLRQEGEDGQLHVISYASRVMTSAEKHYAQIEKEALALAYACDKFKDYIFGRKIVMETDHKPLVPILMTKYLDDLSPRLQRLRLRLMRYDYEIRYVPGKDLVAADTLSRIPQNIIESSTLEEDINEYVHGVISNIELQAVTLEEIRKAQEVDHTLQKLKLFCTNGWPEKRQLDSDLEKYWQVREDINISEDLVLRGGRIVIPKPLRYSILKFLHEGHLGINKCRQKARDTVYWPEIGMDIERMVKSCDICARHAASFLEPMTIVPPPDRPWKRVGMDLFYHEGTWFLLIVDYYSRYPEIAKLDNLKPETIIMHCRSIFARHGIPEEVVSDNGSQFRNTRGPMWSRFECFAKEYGFKSVTCSPKHSQGNGLAEAAVKIIKMRFKKSVDPYLALLAYRSTPIHNGYSPAELLMGRRLRSAVPITSGQLEPFSLNRQDITEKENKYKETQKLYYDRRHRARWFTPLRNNQDVWIKDRGEKGTIVSEGPTPRSYIVRNEKGQFRRNRTSLAPQHLHGWTTGSNNRSLATPEIKPEINTDQQALLSSPEVEVPKQGYTTRFGRTVVPPQRLDL